MTPINAERLTPAEVQKVRETIAAIFLCLRAARQSRVHTAPQQAQEILRRLSPVAYHWHWLAWRMRGVERGFHLARTVDGKVVVISERDVFIGDPMTEQVAQVALLTDTGPHRSKGVIH